MVLLPGCLCCVSCGIPFTTTGYPDSIEVDIVRGTAQSYSFAGSTSLGHSVSGSASCPALTGTYSLSQAGSALSYSYEDSSIAISLAQDLESNAPYSGISLSVLPKVTTSGSLTLSGTTSATTTVAKVGATLSRWCAATPSFVQYQDIVFLQSLDLTLAVVGNDFPENASVNQGVRGGAGASPDAWSFSPGCQIPANVSRYFALSCTFANDTYSESSNTFPSLSTLPSGPFYTSYLHEMTLSFTIAAVRLIYGSTSINYFDDIGQTDCPGF